MITRTKNVLIDIKYLHRQTTNIKLMQGDIDSNIFQIFITDNNTPVDLSGLLNVGITFLKADDTIIADLVSIESASEGVISYTLPTNVLAFPGEVVCSVELYGLSGERLTSNQFIFEVLEQLNDGTAIESADSFPILSQALIAGANEEERVSAEDLRNQAELLRGQQEADRQINTQTAIDNVNVKIVEMDDKITETEVVRQAALTATSEAQSATMLTNEATNNANQTISGIVADYNSNKVTWDGEIDTKIGEMDSTIEATETARLNTIAATNNANIATSNADASALNASNAASSASNAANSANNAATTALSSADAANEAAANVNKHWLWEETKSVPINDTSFVLDNPVVDGQKLIMYDTKYNAIWNEDTDLLDEKTNWVRTGQTITFDPLPIALTFRILNLG